jgi:hypothetical protein
MPYLIMCSHGGTGSNRRWEATDLIFENGAEAGAWCKLQNNPHTDYPILPTYRYKAIKIGDDDPRLWQQREQKRFEDGTYERVPWHDHYYRFGTGPTGLYEHIDPHDPTKVRFIASATDGMQSRYTSMAPGRFIKKFIDNDPPSYLLDEWCAKMGLDMTTSPLMFAITADEIEQVYNEGPHSCMAYKKNHPTFINVEQHPVRVYGNSDLAVAYIMRNGEITARTLCWPKKKIHGRIYGDTARILERLKENDYIENWNMEGAKIRQLRNKKSGDLILPYIDGDLGVVIKGKDWLQLSSQPHIIAKSAYGQVTADHCEMCHRTGVWLEAHYEDDDTENEPQYFCAKGCGN